MKRYLVTTSDEEYWNKEEDILFLGGWCITEKNKSFLENKDYLIAEPFIKYRELENEYTLIQQIIDKLLLAATIKLNELHRVNHDKRYWNIVLGHWLRRFVILSFNRFYTIKNVLSKYEVSGTTIILSDGFDLASPNSYEFIWEASNNSKWNLVFNSLIISFLNPSISVSHAKMDFNIRAKKNAISKSSTKIRDFLFNKFLPSFKASTDAFIYRTYLPLKQEVYLQLRLKQVPQFWQQELIPEHSINPLHREQLKLDLQGLEGLEKFVFSIFHKTLPVCFFEGHPMILQTVSKLFWPSNPKFIFTSNAFDSDEVFKVWVAEKSAKGTPYYVGQHGANYGTLIGNFNWPEIQSADKFLTWGWTDNTSKFIPAFNFKLAGGRAFEKRTRPQGILLIEQHPLHRLGPFDDYALFQRYFKNQIDFVKELPNDIKKELTIRLHSASKHFDFNEADFWQREYSTIPVDNGGSKILDLMVGSKLVVHSYDSTGILESLALNIPTICFWDNEFEHLLESAKPFYKLLMGAKIYFDSPQKATEQIEKIWNDVDSWWYSKEVQDAKNAFMNQYSRVEWNPTANLLAIFAKGKISQK